MAYARFLSMVLVSTIVMYGLTYLNVFSIDHVWFSQMRVWMALLMGATMALVMLAFMWGMYRNRAANAAIIAGCATVFVVALWLARSQQTIGDVAYMKAMVPHHSIAILTSERAQIRDPRVRHLADGIIRAQVKEIGEMEKLIDDLGRNPPSDGSAVLPSYRARGALPPAPE